MKKDKCPKCLQTVPFKKRYVLGIGFPVVNRDYSAFYGLNSMTDGSGQNIPLVIPNELQLNTPKYRVVLERVD